MGGAEGGSDVQKQMIAEGKEILKDGHRVSRQRFLPTTVDGRVKCDEFPSDHVGDPVYQELRLSRQA
jgi:hypothetical protein